MFLKLHAIIFVYLVSSRYAVMEFSIQLMCSYTVLTDANATSITVPSLGNELNPESTLPEWDSLEFLLSLCYFPI
jgi:hypothetical protein